MKVSWNKKPFEDCIEKVTYTTKIQRKDFLKDGAFPIVSQEEDFINGYWDNEGDLFNVTTPVIVFGDHTKILKYIDFDFVLGADGVKILQPRDFLLPKFFYYQLQTANLDSLGYARHYKLLKEVEIVYPTRLEQQRIVSILDEVFDDIATAKANAEKNFQNARALFDNHLQAIITQRSSGWEKRSLITLCSLFVDSAHRTPRYQKEGIPALRPRDVVNGKLNLSNAARVSQEEYEIQTMRHKPAPGDIVYSRELSYGWAALLPKSPRVCLSQGMCIFRPKTDIDPAFLLHILNGPFGREQAERAAVGAAHPHINLGDIKSYLIPLPPLNEQKLITQQLKSLADETQCLESIYRRKLAALDELKQSLLHQAFNGEL
jgi:type I restriction enzyme S subunit